MAIEITSPQNPRIKEVIRLRDRRGRKRQDRFIIDGIRELRRAINSEFEILEVFYDEAMCQDPKISQLLNTATDLDAELIAVPERVMEKTRTLTYLCRHSQAIVPAMPQLTRSSCHSLTVFNPR